MMSMVLINACKVRNRSFLRGASLFLGAVIMAEAAVGGNEMLSQSAPAPATGEVASAIMTNSNARRFADIFTKSELKPREIYTKYATFIAPQDSACTPEDIKYLDSLTTRDAAREYIRGRTFLGSLEHLRGRLTRAFSWVENGENSPPTVTFIDEATPYRARLANGKSVTISIEGELLRVGSKGAVTSSVDALNGGIMYIDYCGPL